MLPDACANARHDRALTWGLAALIAGPSLACVAQPTLTAGLIGDVDRLRAGEWWRALTALLVQPGGLPALAFLLLGVLLLTPVASRFWGIGTVAGTLAATGPGCLAVGLWVSPVNTSAGSSDLVAALVGLTSVALATGGDNFTVGVPVGTGLAAGYCAFFGAYLLLQPFWGAAAGPAANLLLVAVVVACRRHRPSADLGWAVAAIAVGCAVLMAARLDSHGIGILAGAGLALVARGHRQVRARSTAEGH